VHGDPTTEIIAVTFKSKFQTFLNEVDPDLVCTNIIIDETQTNSISFSGNPAEHLPSGTFWWNRADFSTNDL
jgi:6-pyruvoyltetrahydropterin/6-carboxytetrahydropterin synthase